MRSGQRFESLDGLRGIAAIAVLLLHLRPLNAIDLARRGALAVDFFFVLSGFVIAAAYDKRLLNSMTIRRFFLLRLVRLYPLIVIGVIFGMIGYLKLYAPPLLAILCTTGLLLIPTPYGALTEDQPTIAINPPSWSLLWELVVNLLYAVIRPVLSDKVLLTLVVIFGVSLLFTAEAVGTLNVGGLWPHAWAGAPRVGFSFFVGVALLRARRWPALQRFRIPLVPGAIVLAAIMAVPMSAPLELPFQLVSVLLIFPALVAGCANAAPGRLATACTFLGAVSYPAYILQSGILPHLRGLPGHLHLGTAGATAASIVMSAGFVVFSWIVLRLYDEPVRAWLTRTTSAGTVRTPAATAP